jgi:hypothetical protein
VHRHLSLAGNLSRICRRQKEYQTAVVDFLESLSLRLVQTNAQEFLTLSGVPLSLEIHWPFQSVQSSDDEFIHVLARVGTPWSWEVNFTVALSAIDKGQMGLYSLSPPVVERFVVNAIRLAVDRGNAKFYNVGRGTALDSSPSRNPNQYTFLRRKSLTAVSVGRDFSGADGSRRFSATVASDCL